MTSVSARIPRSLKKELDRFMEDEKLDKSTAVRKLISEGLEEWKKEKALKMLEEGKVSFSKAAEIADMNVWSFADMLKERKINWVKDERIREDLEAV